MLKAKGRAADGMEYTAEVKPSQMNALTTTMYPLYDRRKNDYHDFVSRYWLDSLVKNF